MNQAALSLEVFVSLLLIILMVQIYRIQCITEVCIQCVVTRVVNFSNSLTVNKMYYLVVIPYIYGIKFGISVPVFYCSDSRDDFHFSITTLCLEFLHT